MTNSVDPDKKPTNLDLHCLQKQGVSGFSRTRAKNRLFGTRSNVKQKKTLSENNNMKTEIVIRPGVTRLFLL